MLFRPNIFFGKFPKLACFGVLVKKTVSVGHYIHFPGALRIIFRELGTAAHLSESLEGVVPERGELVVGEVEDVEPDDGVRMS